ncbi:MAG: OmpA family protein [Bdellovibrionales bacterium]
MQRAIKVLIVLSCIFLVSCSSVQKAKDKAQGRNQIVGEGSEYISNMDLDKSRGSDSGKIKGLKSVFFGLDSSELSSDNKRILRKNKIWFNKNSRLKRIELEGHCDSLGSQSYNIGLGQKRAKKVMEYLRSIGVKERLLSIISFGEEQPLSSNNNYMNRRVNFVPIY